MRSNLTLDQFPFSGANNDTFTMGGMEHEGDGGHLAMFSRAHSKKRGEVVYRVDANHSKNRLRELAQREMEKT